MVAAEALGSARKKSVTKLLGGFPVVCKRLLSWSQQEAKK
jgi:hypothetical protein